MRRTGAIRPCNDLGAAPRPTHQQARPIYHRIEARLCIVFFVLAATQRIEHRTGWSKRKFVRTTRTVGKSRPLILTAAADPFPTISAKQSPRSAENLHTGWANSGRPVFIQANGGATDRAGMVRMMARSTGEPAGKG